MSATRAEREPVAVGRLDDLADGEISIVEVAGRQVGIVRWGDEVFAVRNVCPHVAGPACGKVRSRLLRGSGTDGELVADRSRPVVVCAWHKWEFDLRNGQATRDPKLRLRTYSVAISDDGEILVAI